MTLAHITIQMIENSKLSRGRAHVLLLHLSPQFLYLFLETKIVQFQIIYSTVGLIESGTSVEVLNINLTNLIKIANL